MESKEQLIKKALGTDSLEITVNDEQIGFPWFTVTRDPDKAEAYSRFVTAIAEMVKRQKRILGSKGNENDRSETSEKYWFRCFLLWLGFIGDGYKAARKILLKNLTGSSAFKNVQKGGNAE